ELLEDVGHLISPLAASYVNDDLSVAPFGQLVLRYRLSRPESSGDACGASLCYREKSVDDPLSRSQRLSREQPFAVGPRGPPGQSLDHRDGHFPAEGVLDLCDYLAAFVKSSGCHPGDLTFRFGRGHD